MKATHAVANIIFKNKNKNNKFSITSPGILSSKSQIFQYRCFVNQFLRICFVLYATSIGITSAMSINNGSSSRNPAETTTPAAAAAAPTTSQDPTTELARSTIDFLTVARGLKTTPRTGWIRQKAGPRIESVADHSWRMSLMAMVAASSANASADTTETTQKYDTNRCIKIAMVHDLAEATVGDITPHCGVSDVTKHDLELRAITAITSKLPGAATMEVGAEILDLWKEYEAGTSPEAKLVKDMDKLEMILQALEYETDGKNEDSLDGFFDSTRGKWRTPIGRAWGEEINRRRPKFQQQQQPKLEANQDCGPES